MVGESISKEQLIRFIDRVERLEEEKRNISDDIKEVLSEAKSQGFEIPILKLIIRLRKIDKEKLAEQDALTELYRETVGV